MFEILEILEIHRTPETPRPVMKCWQPYSQETSEAQQDIVEEEDLEELIRAL